MLKNIAIENNLLFIMLFLIILEKLFIYYNCLLEKNNFQIFPFLRFKKFQDFYLLKH